MDEYRSPICGCRDCRNDEEAGCAVTILRDQEIVQCGMNGGHDGCCDHWEKPHSSDGGGS